MKRHPLHTKAPHFSASPKNLLLPSNSALGRSSLVSISFCHDVTEVCLSGSAGLLKPPKFFMKAHSNVRPVWVQRRGMEQYWNLVYDRFCRRHGIQEEYVRLYIQFDSKRGSYNFVFVNNVMGIWRDDAGELERISVEEEATSSIFWTLGDRSSLIKTNWIGL
jgi:hypothetical protein